MYRGKIAGLYMAAGRGSRMGFSKPAASLAPGIPLGAAALRALQECVSGKGKGGEADKGAGRVHIVVRPEDPLSWLPVELPEDCSVVVCPEAGLGMSYSLRAGLRSLEAGGPPDAVLIALADQPFVDLEWLNGLLKLYEDNPELDYVASGGEGTIMPPVVMSWWVCQAVMEGLSGDRGAGSLLASGLFCGKVLHAEALAEGGLHLPGKVSSSLTLFDVDTPEDLALARELWPRFRS